MGKLDICAVNNVYYTLSKQFISFSKIFKILTKNIINVIRSLGKYCMMQRTVYSHTGCFFYFNDFLGHSEI